MPEIDLGYVLGPKGDPGEPGRDGTDGTPGTPGAPGADGKSAYQYAKEGGFVGTEEQFYTALAEVILKMNKVIPRKVDTIATLSAAGQVQDSGKTMAELVTKEQLENIYNKQEADGRFAAKNAVYTKNETMTAATGQLIASGVTTPNMAFQKLKEQVNKAQSTADSAASGAKIVQGSYVGTGELSKTITLGFKPKLLILAQLTSEDGIPAQFFSDVNILYYIGQSKLYTDAFNEPNGTISISETGITLVGVGDDAESNFNLTSITYRYVGVG